MIIDFPFPKNQLVKYYKNRNLCQDTLIPFLNDIQAISTHFKVKPFINTKFQAQGSIHTKVLMYVKKKQFFPKHSSQMYNTYPLGSSVFDNERWSLLLKLWASNDQNLSLISSGFCVELSVRRTVMFGLKCNSCTKPRGRDSF